MILRSECRTTRSVVSAPTGATPASAARAAGPAERADAAAGRGGALGPPQGAPVTNKKNVDRGGPATASGAPAFRALRAATASPPVANWKRAGAVIVGRTNTPAFSLRWD